jgi:hypothetical protein
LVHVPLGREIRSEDGTNEMFDHIIATHKFTRNIPPSTPKRFDPNEPPFIPPPEFFNNEEDAGEDDL